MTYRKDIDGLRAVAVLLVVLFHADFHLFAGGYVGVDVFFVISGFLITQILLNDLQAGRFSFKVFYIRRVRRLLPALAATVIATLLAGALFMTPAHLAEMATSAVFTVASLSNFYFAMSGSYFSAAAEIKPLLHTWSLSVEEQFYLVWPVSLVLLYRLGGQRLLFWTVVLGGVAGLILSEVWINQNPKLAYFLPMFRGFQFLIGAALVWILPRRLPANWEAGGAALGMALVLGTALLYDAQTPFPGLMALVPSVGALLVLWCGQNALAQPILSNPVAVWMGQVSYSAYLAHWPITVYWRYLSVTEFSLWEKWLLVVLSFAAGAVLHYSVEVRFRLGRSAPERMRWRPMLTTLACMAAVALAALGLRHSDGFPQRMQLDPQRAAFAQAHEFEFLNSYRDGLLQNGTGVNGQKILIFGDSTMQNYIPALLRLPQIADAEVTILTRGGCVMGQGLVMVSSGTPDSQCRSLRDQVFAFSDAFDHVIWSQSWMAYSTTLYQQGSQGALLHAFRSGRADWSGWQDSVTETLAHFAQTGAEITVIGPQLAIQNVSGIFRRLGPLAPLDTIESVGLEQLQAETTAQRTGILEGLAGVISQTERAQLIDPGQLLCGPTGHPPCKLSDQGMSFFIDPVHHSRAATEYLAQALAGQL